MLYICLLLINHVDFTDTGIFKPINANQVAICGDGRLFIIDADECIALIYDAEGNRIGSLGGKGQGPGESEYVFSLSVVGDHVFTIGSSGTNQFTLDGSFVNNHGDGMRSMIRPSSNGWLRTSHTFDMETKTSTTAFTWLDQDQKVVQEIGEKKRAVTLIGGPDGPSMAFNPAQEYQQVVLDRPGKNLLVFLDSKSPIQIYRVVPQFERLLTLSLPEKPLIPFNEEWADRMLEQFKERNVQRPINAVPDYPSHFPKIRMVRFAPDGLIVVSFWTSNPEHEDIICFDNSGKPVYKAWNRSLLERVALLDGDQAYVLAYNEEEEEYFVRRMPFDSTPSWIAEHPYSDE